MEWSMEVREMMEAEVGKEAKEAESAEDVMSPTGFQLTDCCFR